MNENADLEVTINGRQWVGAIPVRVTLADFLREHLRLTGTHIGCEQGVCGACTVLVNGSAIRSCLMLAVEVDGTEVTTVEGCCETAGQLSSLQEAFVRHRAAQCGFCTAGLLVAAEEMVRSAEPLSRDELRERLSGHICRCTGYEPIIEAVYECLG